MQLLIITHNFGQKLVNVDVCYENQNQNTLLIREEIMCIM